MRIWIGRLSEVSAWTFLLAILILGVPIFVCMPIWVDCTYYDVCARNVLNGGVHYRDVFETNLPGMVWLHAIIRPIVGWSSEAFRIVDLGVVSSSIFLLGFVLKRIGVNRCLRAWFIAACFFFYVFQSEFIHGQRDSWMLLPTIVAMSLRGRQIVRAETGSTRSLFRWGLLEGMAWACAIWIKPHCVAPALFVWLAGSRRLAGIGWRPALADIGGLFAGGLLIGGAGSAWLIATGAWASMWDVLLNWNPEYYRWTPDEMELRTSAILNYFAPWSCAHAVAMPLALVALFRARVWRFGPTPGLRAARLDQALLAALYLGWLFEATLLQKRLDYAQAPVIFLALALVAAHRWPVGEVFITWCVLGGMLHCCQWFPDKLAWTKYLQTQIPITFEEVTNWMWDFEAKTPGTAKQLIPEHPLISRYRFEDRYEWFTMWERCFTEGSTLEMKDELGAYGDMHCAPNWTDLDDMKRFLQTLDLKDGDLVCWDDSTHSLYLDLKVQPRFRFIHVNTSLEFRSKRPVMRAELLAAGHKYVVHDMIVSWQYFGYNYKTPEIDPATLIPTDYPCMFDGVYPWNQPVIYRAGRYWLHRVDNPIDEIRAPYPRWADVP